MKLYDYQTNVIETIAKTPSKRQLISMPTGTGKTITFLSCIRHMDLPTLVLVHREELLEQTYEKAKILGFTENEISTITAKDKQRPKKLTISMVQTLNRNIDDYPPDSFQMVVIDEAHHATAQSYLKILAHFRVFEDQKWLLGFTATPLRGDGKALADIFEVHSFKMTLSEATLNGYICPVRGIRIDMKRGLDDIETVGGDYDMIKLDKVMNCDAVNNCIADKSVNLRYLPGIVFCTSVEHAKNVASCLRQKKKKAISISYKNSERYKKKIFQMLRDGRIEFITNAVKLSEGFDFPPIQSIILARPTRSPVLYKQMIGRGLRKADGKHECVVLEFSGNDEKMICWEDIDENCTFQSTSINRQKTIEEAKKQYIGLYRNSPNIQVLDVRVSPFDFYECYLERILNYRKDYIYSPFEEGFIVVEIRSGKHRDGLGVFNFYCHMFFWKEEYRSFYQYGEPDYLNYQQFGHNKNVVYPHLKHFMRNQPTRMGKWYPSDQENIRGYQKSFLGNVKMNARKAEMTIEEKAIMMAINQYIIPKKIPPNLNEVMHLNYN